MYQGKRVRIRRVRVTEMKDAPGVEERQKDSTCLGVRRTGLIPPRYRVASHAAKNYSPGLRIIYYIRASYAREEAQGR